MTSKKVVLEIDGLKQTFNPSTVLKFSFLEEPVVKKNTRDGISTVNTEPSMTDASNSSSFGNRERNTPIRSSGRQSSRTDYKKVEESNSSLFDTEPPEPTF